MSLSIVFYRLKENSFSFYQQFKQELPSLWKKTQSVAQKSFKKLANLFIDSQEPKEEPNIKMSAIIGVVIIISFIGLAMLRRQKSPPTQQDQS